MKPKLLDLFCGGGGASKGYADAGFDVTGVDLYPQSAYPFVFHEAEALTFLSEHWNEFDVIAASPPCQGFSNTRYIHGNEFGIPDQLTPTIAALEAIGKPYIVENVPHAPMQNPVLLCGSMKELQAIYPLRTYRHRHFTSNYRLPQPEHHKHIEKTLQAGLPMTADRWVTVAGHLSGVPVARAAMGIQWLNSRDLVQAIPPAYTMFLGSALLRQL